MENGPERMLQSEEITAPLIANLKKVNKASGDEKCYTPALAFQEGIGSSRCRDPQMHRRKILSQRCVGEDPRTEHWSFLARAEFHQAASLPRFWGWLI